MINDDQGNRILKQLDAIWAKIGSMEGKIGSMDKTLKRHDAILEEVTTMLVSHDNLLKNLPTREEFDAFRNENMVAHDGMTKSIERLNLEFKAHVNIQNRVNEKVDAHERVLISHTLLPAKV